MLNETLNMNPGTAEGRRERYALKAFLDTKAEREAFLHLAVDRFGAAAMGVADGPYPYPKAGGEENAIVAFVAICEHAEMPEEACRSYCHWAISANQECWRNQARAFYASRHGNGSEPDSGWSVYEEDHRALTSAMENFEDQQRGGDRSCYDLLAAIVDYFDPYYLGCVAACDFVGLAISSVEEMGDDKARQEALGILTEQLAGLVERLSAKP